MARYVALRTPYGSVALVASEQGLCEITLTKRPVGQTLRLLERRYPEARHDPRLLRGFQGQLRDFFAGRRIRFRVRLDLSGLTAFQRRVLEACARIGYGQTTTYGALARRIGRPRAARAVGHALGRNPVPLVIPCHRVVASDGSLGGFSAEQGVELKRQLLELEARTCRPPTTRQAGNRDLPAPQESD